MKNELEHDWKAKPTRLRGTLTLGSTKRKPDEPANDQDPDERPAA